MASVRDSIDVEAAFPAFHSLCIKSCAKWAVLWRFAADDVVRGLGQDGAAVRAALTMPWSNGQTEGQITKLKLLKRQMYGRANFDLLRRRVLLAA